MSQYCTAGACAAEPHMNNAFSLLPPPTTEHSRVHVPHTAAQGQQTLPPGAATHTTRGSNTTTRVSNTTTRGSNTHHQGQQRC